MRLIRLLIKIEIILIIQTVQTELYINKSSSSLVVEQSNHPSNLIKEWRNYFKNCTKYDHKLPKAIIIGVKKSGTYALIRYLSLNPFLKPALKSSSNECKLNEIHFFDSDFNYAMGLNWYKKQMPKVCIDNDIDNDKQSFNNKNIIVIEKTPGYFRNLKSISRIKTYSSDIKLILIVRDPIKRLQSELTHCDMRQKKLNLNRKCLKMNEYYENLFLSFKLSNSSNNKKNELLLMNDKFIRNSIYYLDMKNWLNKFELNKSLLVINGELFIKKPWIELNKIEKFLNVPNLIHKSSFHFDKKKKFYCIKNETTDDDLTEKNNNNNNNNVNRTNNLLSIECLGKNKGRKSHVYLSDYVKNELRNYFKYWNDLFYDLIGQNYNW